MISRNDRFRRRLNGATWSFNFTGGSLDNNNGDPLTISFTRNSVGSYYDKTGALVQAAANVPRFEYDPVTLVLRGLLIEESRTNLLLNSATLVTQNVTTAATAYTLSFFGTGTVTCSGTSTTVVNGSGAFPTRKTQSFVATAGTLTLTVTGSVQFAQLEAGGNATSYIPTTGASATRGAETAVISNIAPWFNPLAGSLGVDGMTQSGVAVDRQLVCFSDAAGTSIISIRDSAAQTYQGAVIDGGVSQASINVGTVGVRLTQKLLLSWEANNFTFTANGTTGTADAVGTVPVVDRMYIGSLGAAGQHFNGYIKRLVYYPRTLTQTEQQDITIT